MIPTDKDTKTTNDLWLLVGSGKTHIPLKEGMTPKEVYELAAAISSAAEIRVSVNITTITQTTFGD